AVNPPRADRHIFPPPFQAQALAHGQVALASHHEQPHEVDGSLPEAPPEVVAVPPVVHGPDPVPPPGEPLPEARRPLAAHSAAVFHEVAPRSSILKLDERVTFRARVADHQVTTEVAKEVVLPGDAIAVEQSGVEIAT